MTRPKNPLQILAIFSVSVALTWLLSHEVSILYSVDAVKDLKQLDKPVARRIVLKIQENATQSNPLERAKALTGKLAGRYRYRVGDYRVIFSIDQNGQVCVLKVLRIKHRKDVYR